MDEDAEREDLLRILRDPLLWETHVILDVGEIAEIIAEAGAAREKATALCDDLLTGPSTTWMERFSATSETRTVATVLEILQRVPALLARRPADALQATSIAVAIAEALDPVAFTTDHVDIVRGQALREHGYVLSRLRRHAEALRFVESAERTFAQIDAFGFDLERLAFVKAALRAATTR